MRSFIYGLLTTLLALGCLDARAQVYKCTDAEGSVTYRQTPCPAQKSKSVATDGADPADVDCSYANRFAVATGRLMRGGATSDEIFNRYGGLDSLSKGTIGVINYVYSFRSNDDVSVERIASLTQAKCRAGSLGDVNCPALPIGFTDDLGGCGADDESDPARSAGIEPPPGLPPQTADGLSTSELVNRRAEEARRAQAIATCKKVYRDAIDEIDAEMRRGYTSEEGEVYRDRLRKLTQRMRDCE